MSPKQPFTIEIRVSSVCCADTVPDLVNAAPENNDRLYTQLAQARTELYGFFRKEDDYPVADWLPVTVRLTIGPVNSAQLRITLDAVRSEVANWPFVRLVDIIMVIEPAVAESSHLVITPKPKKKIDHVHSA